MGEDPYLFYHVKNTYGGEGDYSKLALWFQEYVSSSDH